MISSKKTRASGNSQDSEYESGFDLSSLDLKALAELGTMFGSHRKLESTFEWLSEHIKPLIPYDRFVVDVLSPDRETITTIHVVGSGIPTKAAGESESVRGTLAGHVAATGESFLESSVTEAMAVQFPATANAVAAGILSWISVPLRSGGAAFGSAGFLSFSDNQFSERHLRLAEIVSGYIASAVNTDQLLEQLRSEAEILQIDNTRGAALRDIGLVISSSLDLGDVFDEFSKLTKLMIPFEYMSIVSLRDDEIGFRNRFVAGNVESRAPVGIDTSIAGYVAKYRKTLIINLDDQAAIDEMLQKFPDAQFDVTQGYRSILSVPLISGNEVVGVIHFRSSKLGTFTEHNVDTAEQIATYVAPAVVNADLHSNIQQESEIQEVLAEMSRVMSSTVDVDDILEKLAQLMNSVVPTDRLVIALIDDSDGMSRDNYIFGVPIPGWDDQVGIKSRDPWAEETARDGTITITPSESLDTASPEHNRSVYLARQAGLRSAMYGPLVAEGKVIGSVNIKSTWPHAYLDLEKRVFGQIVQQLGGSIAVSEFSAAMESEAKVQEVLAELSRLLSSTVVIGDILDDIGRLMNTLVPTDRFVISLFDENTGRAHDNYVFGISVPGWDGVSDNLPRGQQPSSAALSRSVVVMPTEQIESTQLSDDRPIYFTKQAGLRSAMYAPLIADGKLIGTLNVKSKLPNAYQEREMRVFEKIAQQMTGSIGLSESRATLEAEAKEQETLAKIGRLMSSSEVLNDVFDEFAAMLNDLVPHDRIVLALPDADRRFIVDRFIGGTAIPGWDENPQHDYERYARLIDNDAWVTEWVDLTDSEYQSLPGIAQAVAVGLRSAVTGSLIADGKLIGSVALKSKSSDAFDPHGIRLLERICQQISGAVAASELRHSLQREASEQEKLAELGRIINSSNLLDEVWTDLALLLNELIGADRISLAYRVAATSDEIDVLSHGIELPDPGVPYFSIIYPELWCDPSLPIVLENSDLAQTANAIETEKITRSVGLNSALIAPVIRRDEVVALITFRSTEHDAFTETDLRLAEMITNQVAGGVSNSQAFRALEQESHTREILSELGRILTLSLDLDDIFDQVGEQVQKLVSLDRMTLSMFSNSGTSLTLSHIYGHKIESHPQNWAFPLPHEAYSLIQELRRTVAINDALVAAYPWLGGIAKISTDAGLLSLAISPIIWQDEVIGLLGFNSFAAEVYSESELLTIELVTNRIAGSVAGSAEHQATKQENEVRKALANISVTAARDLNLKNVGERVANGLRSLVPFDRFSIVSYDSETKVGTLEFFDGISLPGDKIGMAVGRYEYPRDWDVEDFEEIVSENQIRNNSLATLGLNSWITQPLGAENSVPIGFINIRSLTPDFYVDEHRELLRQVALQITPAVQNAKVHEQSVQLARQREQSFALDLENKELQRVADSRSEFLSTVSHELRTPLTAISAFADILHRNVPENLTQRQLEQLDVVRRSSTSLAELIDDLLDVSRADSGRLEVSFRKFNFTEAVEEFRVGTMGFIQNKSQTLEIQLPEDQIWLNADKSRLFQILNNLSANASKYSHDGSVIKINIDVVDHQLKVVFEDEGIGISRSDLKRVFTPFFRADNLATRQEIGTGLGLSVVHSLVELHRGSLKLESELGKGTRVELTLPCVIPTPEPTAGSSDE